MPVIYPLVNAFRKVYPIPQIEMHPMPLSIFILILVDNFEKHHINWMLAKMLLAILKQINDEIKSRNQSNPSK